MPGNFSCVNTWTSVEALCQVVR